MKILNRLFGQPEEINGRGRCPTYLYRWFVLKTRSFNVYLHHFVGDDWSLDLHDHPKRFISIGLKGKYLETTPGHECECAGLCSITGTAQCIFPVGPQNKVYHAPWIRTFPATHIHRLSLIDKKDCWTLVITLKSVRPWGFWHRGRFIGWREYVTSETADKMKACE